MCSITGEQDMRYKSGLDISRERTVNRCALLRTVYLILLSSKLIRLEDGRKSIYFEDL